MSPLSCCLSPHDSLALLRSTQHSSPGFMKAPSPGLSGPSTPMSPNLFSTSANSPRRSHYHEVTHVALAAFMQERKESETLSSANSKLSPAASHFDRSAIGCHPLSPALRIRGRKAEATSKSTLDDESWPSVGELFTWNARIM